MTDKTQQLLIGLIHKKCLFLEDSIIVKYIVWHLCHAPSRHRSDMGGLKGITHSIDCMVMTDTMLQMTMYCKIDFCPERFARMTCLTAAAASQTFLSKK